VDALNHHHLYHFWMVVGERGVTRASEKLHVSQPTVNGQLRELQEALGEKLLVRAARTVVLTDVAAPSIATRQTPAGTTPQRRIGGQTGREAQR
jgi:hypothetical protein